MAGKAGIGVGGEPEKVGWGIECQVAVVQHQPVGSRRKGKAGGGEIITVDVEAGEGVAGGEGGDG